MHGFYSCFDGLFYRLFLAALHMNENVGRQQAVKSDGSLRWKVCRPKAAKGRPVVKPIKTAPTRGKVIYSLCQLHTDLDLFVRPIAVIS